MRYVSSTFTWECITTQSSDGLSIIYTHHLRTSYLGRPAEIVGIPNFVDQSANRALKMQLVRLRSSLSR